MTPKPKTKRAAAASQTDALRVGYCIAPCEMGRILVAATARGVCAITLGNDEKTLCRHLAERFAKAELVRAEHECRAWVKKVVAFLEHPRRGLDLPLDVQGTAFQQRVWKALQAIPAGSTASYAQVARKIGKPTAVRAVAGACAANPVALAIPCHRVVRSDGSLGGYRWGLERKRTLLDREAEV